MKEGREWYEKAIATEPENFEALSSMANLASHEGNVCLRPKHIS